MDDENATRDENENENDEDSSITNAIKQSEWMTSSFTQANQAKWTKVVTGKVITVVRPGPREYVAVVSEMNGTG